MLLLSHYTKLIHIHMQLGFVGAKIEKLATCVQLLNGNSEHHLKKLNSYSTSLSPVSELLTDVEYESYNNDQRRVKSEHQLLPKIS